MAELNGSHHCTLLDLNAAITAWAQTDFQGRLKSISSEEKSSSQNWLEMKGGNR